MSSSGGYLVDIAVPNAFGSFEGTMGVMGADAFLLLIFLCCVWRVDCKDVSKPFFCLLTLCMFVSTMATVALFVFKMCKLPDEAAAYASIVRTTARFSCVNSLLFGGGYMLMGAGNSIRTRSLSSCCSSFFIHFLIVLFSLIVGVTSIFFSTELENVPLFLFKTLPTFGVVFLLFGLIMGLLISCCGESDKDVQSGENFLVNAKCRFVQYILFFISPVTIVILTRALDGGSLLYHYILKDPRYFYWSRYRVADLASAYPMIAGMRDIDFFFTLSISISALVFLRSAFCSSSNSSNTRISPTDSTPPSIPSAHPMIMMMSPPHSTFPSHPMPLPTPHPLTPSPLPPLTHPYGVVYGMASRPYIMA